MTESFCRQQQRNCLHQNLLLTAQLLFELLDFLLILLVALLQVTLLRHGRYRIDIGILGCLAPAVRAA